MSKPKLHLWRRPFTAGAPVLGSFLMETAPNIMRHTYVRCIELPWVDNKNDVSCIPPGDPGQTIEYAMRYTMSRRFGKMLWEVTGVEGRTGIRIHAGNFAGPKLSDSEGCLLPCLQWADINKDGVMDGTGSRKALDMLHEELSKYQDTGITLVVRNM